MHVIIEYAHTTLNWHDCEFISLESKSHFFLPPYMYYLTTGVNQKKKVRYIIIQRCNPCQRNSFCLKTLHFETLELRCSIQTEDIFQIVLMSYFKIVVSQYNMSKCYDDKNSKIRYSTRCISFLWQFLLCNIFCMSKTFSLRRMYETKMAWKIKSDDHSM